MDSGGGEGRGTAARGGRGLWRDEDGSLRVYDYRVEDERWIETVTTLHEQAPEPVSGRTTRSATVYDRVGNVVERNQEAFIDGTWHLIDRTIYEHNVAGQVTKETDFAGRETVSVWGDACCGKISETLPNGVCHTYAYDAEGNLLAQTTLKDGSHTVTYRRDALGRVIRVEREGLNPTTTEYDLLGRVVRTVDVQGGVTTMAYSSDECVVTNTAPNLATRIVRKDARGRTLSVEGSAVQPQTFTYGPNWERVATGARWQKTEQNLLGQILRQTRSGVNGSTLETLMTYDGYGRISQIRATGQPVQTYAYDATGEQTALTQTVGEEWRKRQSDAEYLLLDGNVWQKQVAVQSCSDADIAPLTQTAYAQVSGLSVTNTFNQITVDIRGNETRIFGNDTQRITQVPSCTNSQIERYAFGQLVETVDTACVTNRFEYDALDRRVAAIDGRNNRTVYAYDAKGNLVSTTDAVGAVTAYGYDVMGQNVAVTNALGNVTVYTYDVRGRLTSTGGVVYPVNYEYDVYGNRTKMTTFRDEEGEGDVTAWTYDAATGAVVSKTYADGRGPTYTLTDLGQVATRTDARGVVTTYTYNLYGDLVSQTYSDGTPAVTYAYDSLGRQTQVTDAAGTTTFTYGQYGELVSESVSGGYAKTLTRHTDAFGRDVGYSIDGVRQRTLAYDADTGRLSGMDGFVWDYLPDGGNVVWLMLERLATECPCCEIGTIILLGVPNMGIPQDDGTLAYIYATQGAADVANYIINVSSTNDWTQTGFANWANGIDGDEIEGRGIPVGWRDTVSISRENPFAHQNYPNSTSKSQTEGASGHSDLHAPGFANEHVEWINSRIPLLRPLVRQYLKQEKK